MSENAGIRISELTPADNVGLSDLFIVSQYNGLSGIPDNEKYVSRRVTSEVLSRHLLDTYSDYMSRKISEGVSDMSVDMTKSIQAVSTDLGYAISAILGLDACRQQFKGETTQAFGELSGKLDRTRTDLTETISKVSTDLSNKTSETVNAVSQSLSETVNILSTEAFDTISDVSARLKEYTDDVVKDTSVHLSTQLTHTIGEVSTECISSMELCVNTVYGECRISDDFAMARIRMLETLSIYYDSDTNDIVLKESLTGPSYVYSRLNRDDIFIDLLSDLTISSMIDNVKCDQTNLSVWFKVGKPPKKRPIIFPLSTFHHCYVFDRTGSGLSVEHPISGNISVGVDFGQVSSVMSRSFYTRDEVDRNIYTKVQTDKLINGLSTGVDRLVSTVSAETLRRAAEHTDLCASALDETMKGFMVQISVDVVDGDKGTLSTAQTHTNDAIRNISSDISENYVKNDNLSSQTWFLYTDQSPDTPIPFNIVLSVGAETT